jgi:phage head maturation protease
MIRRIFASTAEPVGDRQVRVVWCTDSLARDNAIIEPGGISITNYLKTGAPVLFSHDPTQPIARASELTIGGRCRALWTFPPAGVSARADEILGLIKSHVLTGVSLGFDVRQKEPVDKANPRGAMRYTQVEVIEMSSVACPADVNSVVVERSMRSAMSAAAGKHLIRASEAVDEAARHSHDLGRHLKSGNDRAAGIAHRNLSRCIGDPQRCFRSLADAAMLDDIDNSHELQTSSGISKGTSGGHSYSAPMSRLQRQAEAARLQRPLIYAFENREREILLERARLEACAAAGCFSRPGALTRAQRQEDLRRLARAF